MSYKKLLIALLQNIKKNEEYLMKIYYFAKAFADEKDVMKAVKLEHLEKK